MKKYILTYCISFVVSAVCIGLSFVDSEEHWCSVLCGIGTSGLGAVLLAVFIEICNIRQQSQKINTDRKSILSSVQHDIFNLIANEVVILEKEDETFKAAIEGKPLADIIEKIKETHHKQLRSCGISSDDYDKFNSSKQYAYEFRMDALKKVGGIVDFVSNDIILNRGLYLSMSIFSNNEISSFVMIQRNLSSLRNSKDYFEYTMIFDEFLSWIDIYDNGIFNEIGKMVRQSDGFIDKDGKTNWTMIESAVKYYEIQI